VVVVVVRTLLELPGPLSALAWLTTCNLSRVWRCLESFQPCINRAYRPGFQYAGHSLWKLRLLHPSPNILINDTFFAFSDRCGASLLWGNPNSVGGNTQFELA
jgi:hypothetical protein